MTNKVTASAIEEIHQTRQEISERFGGDVVAIAEDAARRQVASNRPAWNPAKPDATLRELSQSD